LETVFPTYYMAIDKGANLQAVSKIMGHKTTKTTESYYGRIKDMDAVNEIERVFGIDTPRIETFIMYIYYCSIK